VKARLEASDPAVWARTLEALADTMHRKPQLTVHCRQCGGKVGYAGPTDYGPFFVSAGWNEPRDPFPAGEVIGPDGPLKGRAKARFMESVWEPMEQWGPPPDHPDRSAAIALLSLPPELVQDFPDLLVRCPRRHGDTILDRFETLERLRRGETRWKVQCSLPFTEYERPVQLFPEGHPSARQRKSHVRYEMRTGRLRDTR
jgi:hypothetical protein